MFFSPFERMVSMRYLRAKRQEGFISLITWLSLIGIALSVGTLIVVMSVMNGFQEDFFKLLLGFNGHMHVMSQYGPITDYDAMLDRIRHVPDVTGAWPTVEAQALVAQKGAASGVYVRGVPSESLAKQPLIANHIASGALKDIGTDGVVIGIRMAERLNVTVGDTLTLISPVSKTTIFGAAPRMRGYRIAAVYDVGMYEYDNNFVLMPLEAAQVFFMMDQGVSTIEIFAKDPQNLRYVEEDIERTITDPNYHLNDWRHSNSSLGTALKVEQNVMFLILSFMIAIAAFNIISSLIMLVQTKGRDIAILRTMGATRQMIMRIFFLNGATLGISGTVIGVGLGLLVANHIEEVRQIVQKITQTDPFSPEVYFLTRMPSVVSYHDVMWIVITSLGLSFIFTLYPAWRAAKLDPVEALRYE